MTRSDPASNSTLAEVERLRMALVYAISTLKNYPLERPTVIYLLAELQKREGP